jgi:hypothetical protein
VEVHYVMSATSVSIFEDILLHISEYSIFPRLQSQSKTVRGIESQSKSSKLDDKSVENGKFPFLWQFVSNGLTVFHHPAIPNSDCNRLHRQHQRQQETYSRGYRRRSRLPCAVEKTKEKSRCSIRKGVASCEEAEKGWWASSACGFGGRRRVHGG